MMELVKRLQIEVQSELDLVNPWGSPVKGYDQKMKMVKYAILELKHHLDVHSFPDKGTEIEFFKQWLPGFCKQYIYFTLLYQMECTRITSDGETFNTYLENERNRIGNFRIEHKDIYLYYLLGDTERDEEFFIRTPLPNTSDFIGREENFCGNSVILSELLAYEDYGKALEKEIGLINDKERASNRGKLKFIGTKAEAVELIILIHEAKLYDNTLEELRASFEDDTGVDLQDFAIIDNNNRARKKSVHPLLDKFNRTAKERIGRLNA